MTKNAVQTRVDVDVKDTDGNTIDSVGNEKASYTRTEVKEKDEYQKILGDGNARVSVGLDEKIGGPGYSSVGIRINVGINCNQDCETIEKAYGLAFRECVTIMDEIVDKSIQMLRSHIQRNSDD